MSLTGVLVVDGATRADLLRYAGSVERASEHAVAAAITAAASTETGPLPDAGDFRALPGLGAHGVVEGREVIVGREKLLTGREMTIPPGLGEQCREWERSGCTTVLIGWDGRSMAPSRSRTPLAMVGDGVNDAPPRLTSGWPSTGIDMLTQVAAVTKALQSVALGLLEEHLSHCVTQAMAEGGDSATEKVREASDAIARLSRS